MLVLYSNHHNIFTMDFLLFTKNFRYAILNKTLGAILGTLVVEIVMTSQMQGSIPCVLH